MRPMGSPHSRAARQQGGMHMLVGRVTGSVVSSNKAPSLQGMKMLIVQPVQLDTMEMKNDYVICLDDVGAGEGDLVMCAYGSSARQTETSQKKASDFTIYAILDSIDINGVRTYDKRKGTSPCNWQRS